MSSSVFFRSDKQQSEKKKKKNEKSDKVMNLARKLKKTVDPERGRRYQLQLVPFRTIPKSPEKMLEKPEGHRKNQDHPHYNTVKICLNTWKSVGDSRRLAVTQIPVTSPIKTGVKNSHRVKIIANFVQIDNWFMHKPVSFLEKEIKILKVFAVKKDHAIQKEDQSGFQLTKKTS